MSLPGCARSDTGPREAAGSGRAAVVTRPCLIVLAVLSGALGTSGLAAQPYFQQRVDYTIAVTLDDVGHALSATETFVYTNNAPHALDTLWVHLWPNAYRDRNTALCRQLDAQNDFSLHFAPEDMRGFIDSLDFTSEGRKLAWGFHPHHADIGWIALPTPLGPGAKATITTPFHVKLPSGAISRLGHTGQAYYISQWYPKPAVFDRRGWHLLPYLTQGEFYSEFGSFDVSITLPANYVLGATGERVDDPQEDAWMDSLARIPPSFVLGGGRRRDPFPPSSPRRKTVRFRQDDVHDFAWFADKRFQVRKGEVTLERSGRRVTTWALVTPGNAALWADAITYLNESVRLYSRWVGEYPYSTCTAVDGTTAAGGGMEYPMITLINDAASPFELDVVIAHEVGHNWFYGILGSNERDHAWMDEGINSFYEQRYIETRYPDLRMMEAEGVPLGFLTRHQGITYRRHNELLYRFNARRNWDQPVDRPSTDFTELDYGTTVYAKSALVFDHLRSALGDSAFDAAMQAYYDAWHHKHPYPEDLTHVFGQHFGDDAMWCFDQLIGTAGKVDVKAVALENDTLMFRHNAQWNFPFAVTGWSGTESLGTVIDSGVMHEGPLHRGPGDVPLPWARTDRARIDAIGRTLDIDRRDNDVRTTGLLKRWKAPELKFLAGLEREDRTSIYWTPAIARNTHDGWMAGVALYNTVYPAQRLEWVAAPLYGIDSRRLAGGARIRWSHDRLTSGWLRNVYAGVSAQAASLWNVNGVEQWYQRLVPSVQLDPRLKSTGPEAYLRYRSILLWQHSAGTLIDALQREVPVDITSTSVFHELEGAMERTNGMHPYTVRLTGLHHEAFTRLSLDAKWSAIYDRHRHRVTFRAFGGSFLRKDAALMRPEMGWRLYWGSSDLLYDHFFTDRQYVGRNTALQMTKDQGGFKTPTSVGTSDTWIAALNMELDFPFALPLSAFAGYGLVPYTTITSSGRTTDRQGYWEMGIGMRFWRDVVEVWVPLAFSQEIQDEQDLRGFVFTDRIRFVFALEKMDPTQAVRRSPH